MKTKVIYRIVQLIDGKMIVTSPGDIVAWAQANDRSLTYMINPRLRPELQRAPRIQGLCGPMWDGEYDGKAVIRYEDQKTYNILSQ